MSIDPLDRPSDQQPVPGQSQNPSTQPEFVTDNPDIQIGPGNGSDPANRPAPGPDVQPPGNAEDPTEPGLGNPLP